MLLEEKLEHLEVFRRHIWGNPSALAVTSTRQEGRAVEYVDLGSHLEALRLFNLSLKRKILVVQGYRDAMAAFTGDDPFYEDGACVIGQPGIGKSFFVIYAAIERLRGGHPVAVQMAWKPLNEAYVLFRESGTTVHDARNRTLGECVRDDVWALSDATIFTPVPARAFMMPRVRVFQTSSPRPEKWGEWAESCMVFQYIMGTWAMQEIEDLAFVLEYDSDVTEHMKTLAIRYGAVPETVLMTASDRRHQQAHENVVDSVCIRAVQNPSDIFSLYTSRIPDSSAVFFIKPLEEDNVIHAAHAVFVPTEWLLNRLFVALNRHQAVTRAKFINTLSLFPETCSIARRFFEETVYDFLTHAERVAVHWRERDSPEVVELPPLAGTHPTLADLRLCAIPGFYWRVRPREDTDDPAVDGVVVTHDRFYVIVTTLDRHLGPARLEGVTRLWESMPPEKRALQWGLLIVGPIQEFVEDMLKHLDVGDVGVPRLSVGRFVPWLGYL